MLHAYYILLVVIYLGEPQATLLYIVCVCTASFVVVVVVETII